MMVFGTIVLTALWCVLTREFTLANILLGAVISALLQSIVRRRARDEEAPSKHSAWSRVIPTLDLLLFFLWELVVSSVRIAIVIVRPRMEFKKAIVTVRVETESEAELATLSNLVTLTPGTLSLDVSPDGDALYVHVMGTADPETVRREIEDGFAKGVRRVFR